MVEHGVLMFAMVVGGAEPKDDDVVLRDILFSN